MASPDVLTAALWWVLLAPLCTLVHELGHAVFALRYTDGPVLVQVGPSAGAWHRKLGRLELSVSPYGPGGICRSQPGAVTREQRLRQVLGGPAASLVFALALVPLAAQATGMLWTALTVGISINALQCVGNLVPRHCRLPMLRGLPNDGLQALSLLRRQPIPAAPLDVRERERETPARKPGAYSSRPTVAIVSFCAVALGLLALAHRIPLRGGVLVFLAIVVIAFVADRLAATLVRGYNRALGPAAGANPTVAPAGAIVTSKICPSCGAEVQVRAKLCYCDHAFE